jgi:glycosyltransferase involved in cell wall biosynthesis
MAFVPNEIAPKAAINRIPLSFLHISNGEPRKNIEPLLAAFSKFTLDFPEARLTLIGSERYIKLGSYHWLQALGRLPTEKLTAYYQKSAAMILVSDAENAPCVITEALCLGVPVITTLVGGIGELTNDSNSIQIPAFQTHEEKAEKIYLALLDFVAKIQTFDSEQISADALRKFHPKQVGQGLVNAYMNQPCVV